MRRKAITEIPDIFNKQENNIISKEYQFELITPMFGGGTTSWHLDAKNPVRSQSIKGQLRYWWRTMQNEIDYEQLLDKENCLWGGHVSNEQNPVIKSQVSIAVINQKNITLEDITANPKGNALGKNCIPNYVLFPVTENVTKKKESIKAVTQLKFTLLVSYPEQYEEQVTNTLTLWTLFGGVGARTRRGTGSIYCAELMKPFSNKDDIKTWLNKQSSHQMKKLNYARITGSELFIDESNNNASSSWFSLLSDYGAYRQHRRKGQKQRPGRSYWPEPDAIREITRQASDSHDKPVNGENWFPRAVFGLPILTTFSTLGDPTKGKSIHLEPKVSGLEKCERYPSPMTLKVIKLNDGTVLSCCFVLSQKFPEQLKLLVNREYVLSYEQMPTRNIQGKQMNTDNPLEANENIYQHLARYLELEVVK